MKAHGPSHSVASLLVALLVLSPLTAHAQTGAVPAVPVVIPPVGAGSILQQVQPVKPPAPSPTGTGLTIEPAAGPKLPPSAPFEVKTIRISGNTVFDTPTLQALVADGEGKMLTLAQIDELAERITEYYHSHGYPLAQAIIPAQTIESGIVRIDVIEARYGKISLDNSSRVSDQLVQDTLAPLQSGQVIGQAALDSVLLLLSDIPGVVVNATLKPGETVGTSDLLVTTMPGPAVTGNVVVDNYGSRFNGRERIGGTVNFINPLRHGDVLSLGGLSSGSGLNYGRIAYESLFNGQGVRLGGSISTLHYILSGTTTVDTLNAHGTAQVGSLWVKNPFVRSRDVNLYGQIQYDRLLLRDHVDVIALQTDRHLENWTASLTGDARDGLLSGAVNTWSVGFTGGHVGFDDDAARANDADPKNANTQGGFSKWNASFTRLQSLGPKSALYFAYTGQWAYDNLDPAKKMVAGGPYSVRAYDVGAVSGDSGYLGTAEFRYDLGTWRGQWQAVAFVDSAHVTINRRNFGAATNSSTLSGAGLGFNWAGPYQLTAKGYVATPIGSNPALVESTSSIRGWVEIGKWF